MTTITTYEIRTEDNGAYEIVTTRQSQNSPDVVSIEAHCSLCRYVAFTAAPKSYATEGRSFIQDHIDQHAPGRAVNIDVTWSVFAWCNVCDDGGDIVDVDGETLECQQCNTTWNMDGTYGELAEDDDAEPA